jgi:hypothetical protein
MLWFLFLCCAVRLAALIVLQMMGTSESVSTKDRNVVQLKINSGLLFRKHPLERGNGELTQRKN